MVGISEAVRAELRGSGVEIACVMPTVVNTELTAGVGQRLIKPVEADDVANEIVDALEVPRFDVWVPRANGVLFKVVALLPRGWREALGRLMKVDKLMTEVDHGARRAYEERAARERAGAEPRPSRRRRRPSATPPEPQPRGCRRRSRPMGRIYDATWGRAFAALYDRGLKATEEAGLREMRREVLAGASGQDDRPGRRHRRQPRPLSRRRSASWSWPSPTRTCSSSCARKLARVRREAADLVEASAPRSCRSPTTASTPPSSPWSSARSPTRRRRCAEAARVLKPGGRLLFIEHVRAEDPGLARWQDRLEKPWRFLADGCHCNRDTVATIEASPASSWSEVEHGAAAEGAADRQAAGPAAAPSSRAERSAATSVLRRFRPNAR